MPGITPPCVYFSAKSLERSISFSKRTRCHAKPSACTCFTLNISAVIRIFAVKMCVRGPWRIAPPTSLVVFAIITVINEHSIGRPGIETWLRGEKIFRFGTCPGILERKSSNERQRASRAKRVDEEGVASGWRRLSCRATKHSGSVAAGTPRNCGNFVSRANHVMK